MKLGDTGKNKQLTKIFLLRLVMKQIIFLFIALISFPMDSIHVLAADSNCRCNTTESIEENKIISELDDQKRLRMLRAELVALEEKIKAAQIERDKRILDAEVNRRVQILVEQKIKEEKSKIEKMNSLVEIQKSSFEENDYKARIIAKIRSNVVTPLDMPYSATSEYLITLLPGGRVLRTELMRSSGIDAYDLAVERAIKKSQPLPLPPDPSMFSAYRELYLKISQKY